MKPNLFQKATLEIIRSGDKFNAMASAGNLLLHSLAPTEDVKIHLSFQEKGILGEVQYTNFQLRPIKEDGLLHIRLESSAQAKHFVSSEVPFFELEKILEQENSHIQIEKDTLRFLSWHHKELIAAIEIIGVRKKKIPADLQSWMATISDVLSVAIQSLGNDFQLLILKKQLEKQKQKILDDNKLIERQNQIFRSLMETMSEVHKSDMEGVFNYCLHQLHDLFPDMGFGLVVDGDRPDIVQWAAFLGIPGKEQEIILENNPNLIGPLADKHLPELESEELKWNVLPMTGQERRTIGKLLIKGPDIDDHSREIIGLFLDQLSAYSENKLLIRELERLANTDSLTGAFNRHYFNREHERIIQNARKFANLYFSVFVIDLNGLKRVNDDFGHQRGDEMIVKAAEILKTRCRKSDMVCRFGGDEYVVLCPSTTMDQAEHLKMRIRELENESYMVCKDADGNTEVIPIRLSIGLASSSEGTAPTKVLDVADQRMYADKELFYKDKERYR